jgi:hypothetical protein
MPDLANTPRRSPSPTWIAVYTAHNIPEAQIVAGRLQHEGIPAFVHYPVGGMAMGINLGEIMVLVHPDQYDLASTILFPNDPDELPDSVDAIISPDAGGDGDEDDDDNLE